MAYQKTKLALAGSAMLTQVSGADTEPLQDSCMALTLSGGGNMGAYEAGVLWAL
jgi:predicted acylesterase/phospholipase RssA